MTLSPIDRLLQEHDQLRAIGGELSAYLDGAEPPANDALADCRWRMARLILRHLPAEDRLVYRRLELHPDPAVAALAHRYRRELDGLFDLFQEHSARWTSEHVVANWPEYRVAARRLVAGLIERMRHEEEALYPRLATCPELPVERAAGDRNWAQAGWLVRESLGR